MAFVHLHRHSEFSRLDGLGTAKQYAERAKEIGQGALAQTDHGTLSGALHHIQACRDAGILPISGVEAYFRPNRKLAPRFKQREAWHLCLFAKNLNGWHNLLSIVSTAYGEIEDGGGFYQYPCVDFELLQRHREGLACSTACFSSWLANLISGGDSVAVRSYIQQMLAIFGDDLWIEIMPHNFDDQRVLNLELVSIAKEFSIPLLATNDAHFPYKEWAETQRVAKLCGSNSSFEKVKKDAEKGKVTYLGEVHPTLYLCSESDMKKWFVEYHPDLDKHAVRESIENTMEFIKRTTPFMLDRTDKLPRVGTADEAEATLREWIEEGLDRIFEEYPEDHWEKWPKQVYRDRVESEWQILKKKGVIPYFILVGDVIRWAKSDRPLPPVKDGERDAYPDHQQPGFRKRPIRVGLGRGSAAGCLISYLVGIVAIDPISWGLLFERFLNPERKGLPDIDIDFQGDRRPEVKEYIARKHGRDHVADIITHARFQPKSVLQALCRAHDVPYAYAHEVTDTIEIRQDSEETTLLELLPLNDKLQEFKDRYPHIWEHALRLEGTVQNAGKHAAGIIITPKPVAHYMALERGKKGDLVTSWSDAADFPVVSDYGFVKLDALGIKGLTKHAYSCLMIEQNYAVDVDLNALGPLRNPYDVDEEVLEGFRKGYTIGVFQFGGRGITNLLREIQPSGAAFDLAAANALYRPGPMKGGVTWDYARRKNSHEEDPSWYWHEKIEAVLRETYGLISYQEQVMEISKILGNFTGAEADDMRKAMGKLYRIKGGSAARDYMKRYEEKWFAGCTENGIDRKTADEIWHKLLQFGSYGFNKSHSASYALQAYQDMYLKMKFPLEFYAAFLTYEDDDDKKMIAIREARARGVKILPPDINKSGVGWTVDHEEGALRVGLLSIKGIGDVGAAAIIKERAFEDYASVENFRQRVPSKPVNAKAMEALIESGAFDRFGARDSADEKQIAAWEKERLKMSLTVVSGADKYADLLRENIYTQDEITSYAPGTVVIVGGEITKFEEKVTKKGDPFANVTLVFEMNEYRVKFWKEALYAFKEMLTVGNTILVNGSTNEYNGYWSVVAKYVSDDMTHLQKEAA